MRIPAAAFHLSASQSAPQFRESFNVITLGRITALSEKWPAEMETIPFSFRFTDLNEAAGAADANALAEPRGISSGL